MTKPVTIPNTFATATTAIPLSQLDSDFSTVATALNDANTYSNYAADTGVANAYVVTLTGVSTTYSAGLRIQFKAGNANTGASTLNVNGGGTKNITFQDASALSSGTIAANAIVDVMYDGTQFLLMNDPAGTVGTGDVVGPAGATANAVVRFDSTTGKLVKNSVVTIADSTGDMSGVGAFTASGNVTLGDATTDTITLTGTVQPGVVISGSSSGDALRITQTGTGNALLVEDSANPDSSPFVVTAAGDVGIGTSSPSSKLVVQQGSGAYQAIQIISSQASEDAGIRFQGGTGKAFRIQQPASSAGLFFYDETNAATRLTIDSSGNLGLGVTPSAWGAGSNGIEISGYNGQIVATTPYLTLGSNTYYNGSNYIYKTSGTAAYYQQNAGTHRWYNAPSGTANTAVVAASTSYTVVALGTTTLAQWQASFSGLSAIPTLGQVLTSLASPVSPIPNGGLVSQNITFTQAMTLDASGNLGVVTTSPATYGKLAVRGGITVSAGGTSLTGTSFSASDAANSTFWISHSSGNVNLVSDSVLAFWAATSAGGVTERARITIGGDFFIGNGETAASPSAGILSATGGTGTNIAGANLTIRGGASTGSGAGGAIIFSTAAAGASGTTVRSASERARITSGGDLLVGATSLGFTPRFGVSADGSSYTTIQQINNTNTAISSVQMIRFTWDGTSVGRIESTSTATSYLSGSDYRLKENIQPMTGALAKVAALKPCVFNWKIDGKSGQGFIAHELQEVVPECVSGQKDAVDAEGNPQYQGIDTGFLVATLTAAIQEQQAIITSLTARIAALEGTQP